MFILERCPSYRESNKRSKERQGPTLSVRFTEVSVKRESTVELNVNFCWSHFFVQISSAIIFPGSVKYKYVLKTKRYFKIPNGGS